MALLLIVRVVVGYGIEIVGGVVKSTEESIDMFLKRYTQKHIIFGKSVIIITKFLGIM